MNILFSLPRQHPNQAGWYHALTKASHTVRYVVSYSLPVNERGDLPEPDIINNTTLPFLYAFILRVFSWSTGNPAQKPYLLWPNRQALEREIVSQSPDLIIIREALTPLALVTQTIARKHNIPTVHYSQAPLQKQDGLTLKLLRLLKILPKFRMSPTIAPGAVVHEHNKIFYVPLFVPVAVTDIEERQNNTVQLLFVGKYIKRKKHLLLIEALTEILKTHQVKLTMVGSTIFADKKYQEEIMNLINVLKLDGNISILNDVNPLKMGDLYKSHDAFVLPSIDEPFSISPLEAMAYGLPVIVSDTNGCQFHIKEGENGYVVESNDLETLVQSLKKIISPENLTKLQKGALDYTKTINNEENFLTQFDKMTTAITANRN